jgi:hypothetical protein
MEYKKVKGKSFGDNLPGDTFWYVKEVYMWCICSPYVRSIWKDIKHEYQDRDFYTLLESS